MPNLELLRLRTATFALVISSTVLAGMPIAAAGNLQLAPFKDALFAYPEPVAVRDGGAYLDVPYSEARDIDQRDEIPERRVQRTYVDLAPNRTKREETRSTSAGEIRLTGVGDHASPAVIVVFVHGRNGDRRLGMNDWTFGGNFNRLKNLLTRAGGLYVTIDGGQLGAADAKKAGELMRQFGTRYASSRLVLACGSMGGELCWTMLAKRGASSELDGLVLLGSNSDMARFVRMEKGRRAPLPIVLAQGLRDKVYPLAAQEAFFDELRRERPDYPIRFIAFENGNHGTPIRMIDWRETLNWILSQ